MSWSNRANGRRYYTRSTRQDGKIVKQYLGAGPMADAVAAAAAIRLADQAQQREAERIERSACAEADGTTAETIAAVRDLIRATLLSAAFQLHARSEWRLKNERHVSDPDTRSEPTQ